MNSKIRYVKDKRGKRHRLYLHHGFEGWWDSYTTECSGCYETIDGYDNCHYPWDDKAGCRVGGGCSECGYTGKRRQRYFVPLGREAFEKYCDEQYKLTEVSDEN